MKRCDWVSEDQLYQDYHDNVWGVEEHDEKQLFKMLCLEGMQSGLSWYTILKKEAGYDRAFENWDTKKIATFDEAKFNELMLNPEIVRNRLKINAIIENAKAYEQMKAEGIDFGNWIWQFVDHQQQVNTYEALSDVPAFTDISTQMSKALKKRGFRFVGPTTCYAFMQAVGMVDDHMPYCFKRQQK